RGQRLRTPLSLRRPDLEPALHKAQTTDELGEAVRWSSYEADRLSQLAEDLLLIARADRSGRLPLRREPVEVDALFAAVSSRFEWRAAELGKALTSTPADGLQLDADRMRLEQALGNPVGNAPPYGGAQGTPCAGARGRGLG